MFQILAKVNNPYPNKGEKITWLPKENPNRYRIYETFFKLQSFLFEILSVADGMCVITRVLKAVVSHYRAR